jgi:transposase
VENAQQGWGGSFSDSLVSQGGICQDSCSLLNFAITVQANWTSIIHLVQSHIINGILEGMNSNIQLAKCKRRARGYRNISNFINMIYFLCGELKFDYPLYFK